MRSPDARQMFPTVSVLTICFLVADAFHTGDYHKSRRDSLSASDLHLADSYVKDASSDNPSLNEIVEDESTTQGSTEEVTFPTDSPDGENDFNVTPVHDSSEDITTSDYTSAEGDEGSTSTESTTSEDYYDYYEDSSEDVTESERETIDDIKEHEHWYLLENFGNCGKRKLQPSDKTIGGRSTELAEFPWMARLIFRSDENDEERGACGGSIINDRYILTAAHCCITDDGEPISIVRLGEYDVHRTIDCFRGQCAPPPMEYGITDVIKHYSYNPQTLRDDICLLRLTEQIEFNDYIQPICLPTSEEMMKDSFIGRTLTVSGWGEVESWPDSRIPDILQEVNVRVLPSQVCQADDDTFVADSQICAGGSVGMDACAGDSGGPLMHAEDVEGDVQYFQIGLVSSGQPCSHRDTVAVYGSYTRVSYYLKWILDMIE